MSVGPDPEGRSGEELLRLGAEIVAAYVSRNAVSADAVPEIIRTVHQALESLSRGAPAPVEERPKPAVPISRSVQHDYIVCLEDGKRFKSLKRHLRTQYNLSPDQYRDKWGLPRDYPMVAPNYAATRSRGSPCRSASARSAAVASRVRKAPLGTRCALLGMRRTHQQTSNMALCVPTAGEEE